MQQGELNQVINGNISTLHKGKGYFSLPITSDASYSLDVPTSNGQNWYRVNIDTNISSTNVTFEVLNDNKVLDNEEDLLLMIRSSANVRSNDTYVISVMNKERTLFSEQIQLNPSESTLMSISHKNFSLMNGGILEVALHRMSDDIVFFCGTPELYRTAPSIYYWKEYQGSILFFKKPSEVLDLRISTDKDIYEPGEQVTYTVEVYNTTTGALVSDVDTYVSMRVTDETVFNQIPQRKQPPSFATQIYIENEIYLENYEQNYANYYVDKLFDTSASDTEIAQQNFNLALLLGIQAWRLGQMDLPYIQYYKNTYLEIENEEFKAALQRLYSDVIQEDYEIMWAMEAEEMAFDDAAAGDAAV